jgi:tetratricopeptide (TPR) repeat protein
MAQCGAGATHARFDGFVTESALLRCGETLLYLFMSTRIGAIWLPAVLAAAIAIPTAASAQSARRYMEPPGNLPGIQHGDKALNLDRLFDALKVAPDNESAKYVETRIWSLWLATDSDTTTLLMSRVKTAIDGKDLDLAIKLLNAIIEIRPDYIEAWNRRATVYYLKKDFEHSIADIEQVLKREPRHFGALSGLGMIFQELGDDKDALQAYRRALAVHPHLERIPDLVKQLTEKVEGRDI